MNKNKKKEYLGKLGLLVTAMIWGSGFTFSSIALEYFTTFQIIALRFSIAFIILMALNAKRLKEIKPTHLFKGSVIGAILFLSYFLQTTGLEFTTTSKNSFLTAVNVVLVPFISWIIIKKPLSKNTLLGAFISLLGIAFTSFAGSDASGQLAFNIGDVISLVGAIFFGAHIFYTDHYGGKMESCMVMVIQMGVAALLSWIAVLFTGETQFDFSFEALLPILYIGIIATLVGYGIQTASQKHTTSGQSAVILSTEAFFGMITAILLLNEPVLPTMVIGGILIFLGILVVELQPLKE